MSLAALPTSFVGELSDVYHYRTLFGAQRIRLDEQVYMEGMLYVLDLNKHSVLHPARHD